MARFTTTVPPVLPTPAVLHEAFLWSQTRLVTKTATVSLHGNTYEVDAALVGRRVELVFDPFDLSDLQVRYQGRDMGAAVGHHIGRHVHPAAKPETSPQPATPTGIDYLTLVRDRHTATLGEPPVKYADVTPNVTKTVGAVDITDITDTTTNPSSGRTPTEQAVIPGQLDILQLLDPTTSNNTKERP